MVTETRIAQFLGLTDSEAIESFVSPVSLERLSRCLSASDDHFAESADTPRE